MEEPHWRVPWAGWCWCCVSLQLRESEVSSHQVEGENKSLLLGENNVDCGWLIPENDKAFSLSLNNPLSAPGRKEERKAISVQPQNKKINEPLSLTPLRSIHTYKTTRRRRRKKNK
jgi:hypothetical protein